ncbi:MAG: O-antigen ligase family protein [Pseudomonadota bacterium]
MNTCFFVYFIFFQRKIFYNKERFPLKIAFILCLTSILISTVFSNVDFLSAITRALRDVINIYLFIYILWSVLRNKEDIVFLIMGFSYIFIILGLYGFYEKFIGANPLIDYQISLNPTYNVIQWIYNEERLNFGRVRSAILHPIGFGVYLSIILSFYFFIQNKFEKFWEQTLYLKIFLFLLCICCLFFTNSRGPMLYLFISVPFAFSFKNPKTYQFMYIGIIGIFFAWNFIEPYFLNIISIYDRSAAFSVGGSTLDMRIYQFKTALNLFSSSPLIGLGIKSMDNLLNRTGILGGESIWLWLLIERGILGCVSHIILIIYIAKIGKGEMKYFLWGSTLAWLITTSVTSTPGIEISFFLTIILILNRIYLIDPAHVIKDKNSRTNG